MGLIYSLLFDLDTGKDTILSIYSPVCGQGPHLFEDAGVLGAVTIEDIVDARPEAEAGAVLAITGEDGTRGPINIGDRELGVLGAFTTLNEYDGYSDGTDVEGGGDSCQFANDGTCDEPTGCDTGTDTTDCYDAMTSSSSSSSSSSSGDDSCQYANDGDCDEPTACDTGTDTTDCSNSGDRRLEQVVSHMKYCDRDRNGLKVTTQEKGIYHYEGMYTLILINNHFKFSVIKEAHCLLTVYY